MQYFLKFGFVIGFLFFALPAFSQVPDPNGDEAWDYCPCVEGVQVEEFICPCPVVYPPTPTGGSGNPRGNGVPDPTGDGGGGGMTPYEFMEWLNCLVDPDCI